MASRYYGADVGDSIASDITEAASTTGKSLQLTVDMAVFTTELSVVNALDAIKNKIKAGHWPPA